MKIVYGTLLLSSFILTAYLVFSVEKIIPSLQSTIADSQKIVATLQEQLNKQQTILLELQAELSSTHKELKKITEQANKTEDAKATVKAVQFAYAKIQDAETARKASDLNKAAELLLSTKEALWKASEDFPSEQTGFRGLMAPIDVTASKWKSGNASAEVAPIAMTVKTLLDKISREP